LKYIVVTTNSPQKLSRDAVSLEDGKKTAVSTVLSWEYTAAKAQGSNNSSGGKRANEGLCCQYSCNR
jgi:hypothetical protein